MNRTNFLPLLLILILAMTNSTARPSAKKERFANPSLQFAGTWRVHSYDLRSFNSEIPDIEAKMREEAGFFPIGQRIRFEARGMVVLPGSVDPLAMSGQGLTGEELEMTLLQPFEKKLCTGYWSYVCNKNSDYRDSVMISEIWKWTTNPEPRATWPDVKPVSYTVVQLGKGYTFEVWFAKNGDLMISLLLYSHAKDGSDSGIMAVRLKAVEP